MTRPNADDRLIYETELAMGQSAGCCYCCNLGFLSYDFKGVVLVQTCPDCLGYRATVVPVKLEAPSESNFVREHLGQWLDEK